MLVCGDSSVGLSPELTVSNPLVVVFPGKQSVNTPNCVSHFGVSLTSPLRPEPPRVNYRQITSRTIHPHLLKFLLYSCQGRLLPRPSALFRPNIRPTTWLESPRCTCRESSLRHRNAAKHLLGLLASTSQMFRLCRGYLLHRPVYLQQRTARSVQ